MPTFTNSSGLTIPDNVTVSQTLAASVGDLGRSAMGGVHVQQ